MAPLSSVKERARALKERVFSKRNTRTIQLDESGSPSTAPAFKEAVRTRDSNIAAGPNAAVPKEEQPPNSTVAGNSRIAATVDKQLSHSASAKRSGLSSDIVVSQVDTPTPGGHSIDRVIPATLASVTCPDGSDQVQPISTDIGGHPSQKEELLRPVEPVFESPYMKLAIQSLEDKKGYEHLTKYIDQLGCEGAEQIISQFEKDVSQKLGPEALHGTSVLGMKVQRLLPVLGYAKPLVTSIAKLDPHHIAPWVCAGVFFALEVLSLFHFHYCSSTSRSKLLTIKSDWTGISQPRNSVDYSRYPFRVFNNSLSMEAARATRNHAELQFAGGS
jgi:hypothetical protein